MTLIDLLADPSRLTIARQLAAAPGSSAPELARSTGLHLNTVRAHLAALADAGAVEREAESGGLPGRPVVRYRLRRGLEPAGDELLPLSRLLARALVESHPDPEGLRAAGLEWGRGCAAAPGEDSIEERLRAALETLGFNVRVEDGRLTLRGCPCPLVAPSRPGLVCGLADAVIDGALEGSGARARHETHDPAARRCAVAVETS
jgi:predicted ArsR family transcriptional regulator